MADIHQQPICATWTWKEHEENWRKPPISLDSTWTVVDCFHPYQGNVTYFLSVEDFQQSFMHLIRALWANNYIIIVRSAV